MAKGLGVAAMEKMSMGGGMYFLSIVTILFFIALVPIPNLRAQNETRFASIRAKNVAPAVPRLVQKGGAVWKEGWKAWGGRAGWRLCIPPFCWNSHDFSPVEDGEVCRIGKVPLLPRNGGAAGELSAGGGGGSRGVGSRSGRVSRALLAREGQQ